MARSTNQRRRTHLKTATAPTSAKDKHGTRDSQVRHTRLAGRGGKSPKPPLGKRNAPRQRRQGERGRAIVGKGEAPTNADQPRRAQEQRTFSPQVGTSIALALGRGEMRRAAARVARGRSPSFAKQSRKRPRGKPSRLQGDYATPNAAAPRPKGQRL